MIYIGLYLSIVRSNEETLGLTAYKITRWRALNVGYAACAPPFHVNQLSARYVHSTWIQRLDGSTSFSVCRIRPYKQWLHRKAVTEYGRQHNSPKMIRLCLKQNVLWVQLKSSTLDLINKIIEIQLWNVNWKGADWRFNLITTLLFSRNVVTSVLYRDKKLKL